jgi:hypothetical protein
MGRPVSEIMIEIHAQNREQFEWIDQVHPPG